MNSDDLLKIERQGYDFVRALIPHLESGSWRNPVEYLWEAVTYHRRHHRIVPGRMPPEYWRHSKFGVDRAFFAGAETAIREYEAQQ